MYGRKNLLEKTDIDDHVVHIKLDDTAKDKTVGIWFLEQSLQDEYDNATVTKDVDIYGRLTDIWITFSKIEDAIHFKLKRFF